MNLIIKLIVRAKMEEILVRDIPIDSDEEFMRDIKHIFNQLIDEKIKDKINNQRSKELR